MYASKQSMFCLQDVNSFSTEQQLVAVTSQLNAAVHQENKQRKRLQEAKQMFIIATISKHIQLMFYEKENALNTLAMTRAQAHIVFWPSANKLSETRVRVTKSLA